MLNKTLSSRNICMFVDVHGHSRKKNLFMYGCNNKNSDKRNVEKLFPLVFSKASPSFSFDDCNFNIQKDKESTGRVVVRREFNVVNSFTLEASFCGANIGKYQDSHFTPTQLKEAGKDFCIALNHMSHPKIQVDLLKELQSSIVPSNNQIEKILREFSENTLDIENIEDDETLRKNAIKTEMKLSRKGKRQKAEFKSHNHIDSLSVTPVAEKFSFEDDNFSAAAKPHATAPFFRTKSYILQPSQNM